jgi:type VI secretion system secreted protein Hcp
MAANIFLKLDGIDGESTDDKHPGWIEVLSYSWGVSNTASLGGRAGAGAGRAEASDFSFMHGFDKASPALFQKCVMGEHVETGELHVVHAGDKPEAFLIIKFGDILISSVQDSGADDRPTESVSFDFASIHISYREQDETGKLGEPIEAGWNFAANKKA